MLKVWPAFFLLFRVKCEKREKSREELSSKMEPGLDGLGNSQATQTAKMRRFTVRKVCSQSFRVWLDTNFASAKETGHRFHKSPQPSHRSQGQERNHTGKTGGEIAGLMG